MADEHEEPRRLTFNIVPNTVFYGAVTRQPTESETQECATPSNESDIPSMYKDIIDADTPQTEILPTELPEDRYLGALKVVHVMPRDKVLIQRDDQEGNQHISGLPRGTTIVVEHPVEPPPQPQLRIISATRNLQAHTTTYTVQDQPAKRQNPARAWLNMYTEQSKRQLHRDIDNMAQAQRRRGKKWGSIFM